MYVSSAAKHFTEAAMLSLLKSIQGKNEARGISGILLYAEGNIIQVLEGEQEVIETLFEKIKNDRRHSGLMIISKGRVEQRDFPNFAMGFVGLKRPIVGEFDNLFDNSRHFPQEKLDGLSKKVTIFLKTFLQTAHVG